MRLRSVLVAAVLLAWPCILAAQSDAIDQWIEGFLRNSKTPGLALAIVKNGQIIKAKGYGLANVELQVPVTTSTIFQSASLAKPITATAILILAEDGKLSLDDPISKYLDGTPASWGTITLRHLLTHTSGIPDYEDHAGLDVRHDYTEPQLLQAFAGMPLLFRPGEEWSYSNTGYVLLGMVIHRVTGDHWSSFVRQRIFKPLGMETARMISEADIIPNRAAGYRMRRGELLNQEWVAPGWNTTADGSLYWTILDLAKWDAGLRRRTVISDSSFRMAIAPTRLNDGSVATYGLGWFLADEPVRSIYTSGEWQGFRGFIVRFLDDSLSVMVLTNSNAAVPGLAAQTVAQMVDPKIALRPRQAIRLPPDQLRDYVGPYLTATGDTLRISQTEDGIALAGLGPTSIAFRPDARDAFFLGTGASRLVFVRDPSTGRIAYVRLLQFPGSPARAKKVQ